MHDRHRRWSAGGTREQVLDRSRTACDVDLAAEQGEWVVGIDSTVVRAHHDAAGARGDPPEDVPAGRLALQVPADARCRPLDHLISPGRRGDTSAFDPLVTRLRIARAPARTASWATRRAPPCAHALTCADGGSAPPPRSRMTEVGARRRGRVGGRPPTFDAGAHEERNTVERSVDEMEDHRVFAVRTDERGHTCAGTTAVAAVRVRLADPTRGDPSNTP